jgi:hypothetical protein
VVAEGGVNLFVDPLHLEDHHPIPGYVQGQKMLGLAGNHTSITTHTPR